MTPQELRDKKQLVLEDFAKQVAGEGRMDEYFNTLDILDALDRIDQESISPAIEFYDLVNEIDNTRKLLNAAQGNPTRIVMVLDMLTAVCVRYAEMLEK